MEIIDIYGLVYIKQIVGIVAIVAISVSFIIFAFVTVKLIRRL